VGKTEIAAEYAHRYRQHYDLVWWVRAEAKDLISNSLIVLGQELKLPNFTGEERDYSIGVVLGALNRGEPIRDWLLIFDNATPAAVSDFIPKGTGHVIITSRYRDWQRALRADGIEVGGFTTTETVEFLRKRVPQLRVVEPVGDPRDEAAIEAENKRRQVAATDLARELDDLPIAAEHAAAYLKETGMSTAEYIDQFRSNAHELLASEANVLSPQVVTTTWRISQKSMSSSANALFELLSFFSPEPISEELLVQPTRATGLPQPLDTVLSGITEFRKAGRELYRYSLVKIDGVRNVIQQHRVVQAVTAGRLEREDPEWAKQLRETAHKLLAASDPGSPDREDSEPFYERSRQHLLPTKAIESDNPHVRRLIINQARRLMLHGGYDECLRLGQAALDHWRRTLGPDDRQTLALAIQVASALRNSGRARDGIALNEDTLERLRSTVDETDLLYLNCARQHAWGLMLLGRYAEALELNQQLLPVFEREMRAEHLDTLNLRNNIAVNLRCLGRFEEAQVYDKVTLAERERILGPVDDSTLGSKMAVSRNLRRLGRLEDAADLMREVNETLEHKREPWNRFRLLMLTELGICLRRIGLYEDAAQLTEDSLRRTIDILGPRHWQTMLTATNLVNDRRLIDDFAGAQQLGERLVRDQIEVNGPDHPSTLAAQANLAIVLRERGNPRQACELDEEALAGFQGAFGDTHPSTLIVMTNLASDLAGIGEVHRARELGEIALRHSTETRGARHIATLATAANLSIDRRADGDAAGAIALHEHTMAAYREVLSDQHPQVRRAVQRGRVNLDLEAMFP
jgi:tetratricopeptide (TPR) repeat protein